nr:SIMPL domain-containing protein [Rhodococcus erythropolis]
MTEAARRQQDSPHRQLSESYCESLEPEAANSPAAVIAACVSVGGDAIRLDGLEVDLDDRSDLATKARELAWTAAESKARQFADLADKDLVEVLEVLEDFDQIVPMRGRVAAMKADSAPIAVERRRDRRIDLCPRSMGYGVTELFRRRGRAVDQPGMRISE